MRRFRRGTGTLEMVFAIPILLVLLAAMVDFSIMSLINHQLTHAARVASRWGITGQTPTEVDKTTVPIDWCDKANTPTDVRITKMRQLLNLSLGGVLNPKKLCVGVLSYNAGYQAVGDPEPYIDKNGNKAYDSGEAYTDVNLDGKWSADQGKTVLGAGGDVAVYILRYQSTPVTGLTPGLPDTINYSARVVVRNEPYLSK